MKVGETYREDNRTMVWVICPECRDERGVKKKYNTDSAHRLCKVCNLKRVKEVMASMWMRKTYDRQDDYR